MTDKCVACGEVAEGKPLYKRLGPSNECNIEVYEALHEMQLLSLPVDEKNNHYICWDCDEIIAEEYVTFITQEKERQAEEAALLQQQEEALMLEAEASQSLELQKKLKEAFKKGSKNPDALPAHKPKKTASSSLKKYKEPPKKEAFEIEKKFCVICKTSLDDAHSGIQHFNLRKGVGDDYEIGDILMKLGMIRRLTPEERRTKLICSSCYNKVRRTYRGKLRELDTSSEKSSVSVSQVNGEPVGLKKHRPTAQEHAAEIAKLIPPSLANMYKVITEDDSNDAARTSSKQKSKPKIIYSSDSESSLSDNEYKSSDKSTPYAYGSTPSSFPPVSTPSLGMNSTPLPNKRNIKPKKPFEFKDDSPPKKEKKPSKSSKPSSSSKSFKSSEPSKSSKSTGIRTIQPIDDNSDCMMAPVSYTLDSDLIEHGICNLCGVGYNSRPKDFWSKLADNFPNMQVIFADALQLLDTKLAEVSKNVREKGLVCRPCFSRVFKGFRSQILQRIADKKGVRIEDLDLSKVKVKSGYLEKLNGLQKPVKKFKEYKPRPRSVQEGWKFPPLNLIDPSPYSNGPIVYKFKRRPKSKKEKGSIRNDLELISLINKSQHLKYKGKVVLLSGVSVNVTDISSIIPFRSIVRQEPIRLECFGNIFQFGNFHRNLKNRKCWHECIICQKEGLNLERITRWLEDPVAAPNLMVPIRWAQLSIGVPSSNKFNLATNDGKVCKRCHRSIKESFTKFVSTKVATSHGLNSEKIMLEKYKVSFDSLAMNIVADPLTPLEGSTVAKDNGKKSSPSKEKGKKIYKSYKESESSKKEVGAGEKLTNGTELTNRHLKEEKISPEKVKENEIQKKKSTSEKKGENPHVSDTLSMDLELSDSDTESPKKLDSRLKVGESSWGKVHSECELEEVENSQSKANVNGKADKNEVEMNEAKEVIEKNAIDTNKNDVNVMKEGESLNNSNKGEANKTENEKIREITLESEIKVNEGEKNKSEISEESNDKRYQIMAEESSNRTNTAISSKTNEGDRSLIENNEDSRNLMVEGKSLDSKLTCAPENEKIREITVGSEIKVNEGEKNKSEISEESNGKWYQISSTDMAEESSNGTNTAISSKTNEGDRSLIENNEDGRNFMVEGKSLDSKLTCVPSENLSPEKIQNSEEKIGESQVCEKTKNIESSAVSEKTGMKLSKKRKFSETEAENVSTEPSEKRPKTDFSASFNSLNEKKLDDSEEKNPEKLENTNSEELENKNSEELENKNLEELENKNSEELDNKNSEELGNQNSEELRNQNSEKDDQNEKCTDIGVNDEIENMDIDRSSVEDQNSSRILVEKISDLNSSQELDVHYVPLSPRSSTAEPQEDPLSPFAELSPISPDGLNNKTNLLTTEEKSSENQENKTTLSTDKSLEKTIPRPGSIDLKFLGNQSGDVFRILNFNFKSSTETMVEKTSNNVLTAGEKSVESAEECGNVATQNNVNNTNYLEKEISKTSPTKNKSEIIENKKQIIKEKMEKRKLSESENYNKFVEKSDAKELNQNKDLASLTQINYRFKKLKSQDAGSSNSTAVKDSPLESSWDILQKISLDDLFIDNLLQPVQLKNYNVELLLALDGLRSVCGFTLNRLTDWLTKLMPVNYRDKFVGVSKDELLEFLKSSEVKNKKKDDLVKVLPTSLFTLQKVVESPEKPELKCFIEDFSSTDSNSKSTENISSWIDFLRNINLEHLFRGIPCRLSWEQFNNGVLYALWRVNKLYGGSTDNLLKWLSLTSTTVMKEKNYLAMSQAAEGIHRHLQEYPEEVGRLVAPVVVKAVKPKEEVLSESEMEGVEQEFRRETDVSSKSKTTEISSSKELEKDPKGPVAVQSSSNIGKSQPKNTNMDKKTARVLPQLPATKPQPATKLQPATKPQPVSTISHVATRGKIITTNVCTDSSVTVIENSRPNVKISNAMFGKTKTSPENKNAVSSGPRSGGTKVVQASVQHIDECISNVITNYSSRSVSPEPNLPIISEVTSLAGKPNSDCNPFASNNVEFSNIANQSEFQQNKSQDRFQQNRNQGGFQHNSNQGGFQQNMGSPGMYPSSFNIMPMFANNATSFMTMVPMSFPMSGAMSQSNLGPRLVFNPRSPGNLNTLCLRGNVNSVSSEPSSNSNRNTVGNVMPAQSTELASKVEFLERQIGQLVQQNIQMNQLLLQNSTGPQNEASDMNLSQAEPTSILPHPVGQEPNLEFEESDHLDFTPPLRSRVLPTQTRRLSGPFVNNSRASHTVRGRPAQNSQISQDPNAPTTRPVMVISRPKRTNPNQPPMVQIPNMPRSLSAGRMQATKTSKFQNR